MSAFSLRPVHNRDSSPSPTASSTSPDDHHHNGPAYKLPPTVSRPSPPGSSSGRPRRPFSPSSLRDLDLTQSTDVQARKYPAPPTGHDLMAMFPPPPPDNFPEMRPGPTSGYFQRQERDFFKNPGKEILRVRLEVDMPYDGGSEHAKQSSSLSRANSGSSSRPWPPPPGGGANSSHLPPVSGSTSSHSPHLSSQPSYSHSHPGSRASPRGVGALSNSSPLFPLSTNHPHPHSHSQSAPPSNLHPSQHHHQNVPLQRTPPQDHGSQGPGSSGKSSGDGYPAGAYDDDEEWRRPMPLAERRRAGKHTRRVIVRT